MTKLHTNTHKSNYTDSLYVVQHKANRSLDNIEEVAKVIENQIDQARQRGWKNALPLDTAEACARQIYSNTNPVRQAINAITTGAIHAERNNILRSEIQAEILIGGPARRAIEQFKKDEITKDELQVAIKKAFSVTPKTAVI
jgi:hypothetical protein